MGEVRQDGERQGQDGEDKNLDEGSQNIGGWNTQDLGYYFVLAQVGVEMVAPLIIGVILDRVLGWAPWGVVTGAIFGFVGGMVHLVVLTNRFDRK